MGKSQQTRKNVGQDTKKKVHYDFDGLAMKDPQQLRSFLKNISAFRDRECPELPWNVRLLWPDKTDEEIANTLVAFFNQISSEFQLIESCPKTYDRSLPSLLLPKEVSERLKNLKKPKSRIGGDQFPALVN